MQYNAIHRTHGVAFTSHAQTLAKIIAATHQNILQSISIESSYSPLTHDLKVSMVIIMMLMTRMACISISGSLLHPSLF